MTTTVVKQRPVADQPGQMRAVTADDAFVATVRFASGALGTLEGSKVATGRKNQNTFEINASRGSVVFDLERLNELQVYLREDTPKTLQGFGNVLITATGHPYHDVYWPSGHIIGWEHTFLNETQHLLSAIVNDGPVAPYGATFEDGYRSLCITEAIIESDHLGRAVDIAY
jgi:predicted dehydrogenase